MTPPAISDVRGCGREVWLERQGTPLDDRIATETDGITMIAETTPPREYERTSLSITPMILEVKMVQSPQRIKPFDA